MANKIVATAFAKLQWAKSSDVDAFLLTVGELEAVDVARAYEALIKHHGTTTQNAYKLGCMALIGLVQKKPSIELFVPFVRGLKTPNALIVETLGHVLPLVNNPKEHGALVALLADATSPVRLAAEKLLGVVARESTIDALVPLVKQRGFQGRINVMNLARRFGPKGIPVLEACLSVPEPDDVAHAVAVLGTKEVVGDDPANVTRILEPFLSSPDDAIAARAIVVFGSLCDEPAFFDVVVPHIYDPRVSRIRAVMAGLVRFPGPSANSTLEFKFTEGPDDVRMAVLQTLEAMGRDEVLPLLVQAVGHGDLKIQAEATRILRELTASERVDIARTLLWLLRSDDVQVRRMATEIMSAVRTGKEQIWPKLVRFLRDEDWWVRERVLDALVLLAGKSLTPHLGDMLLDDSAGARRVAVDGMGRVKDPAALGALVRAASDDADWWVREEAVRAIGEIKDARAVPHVLSFLDAGGDLVVACIDTLSELDPSVIDHIVKFLGDEDAEKRLAALRFLNAHGDATHADAVRLLAFDAEPEVCQRARDLLDAWAVSVVSSGAGDDDPARVLDRLFEKLVGEDGDDLILSAGRRVYMKKRGKVIVLTKAELSAEQVYVLLAPLLSTSQTTTLAHLKDVDFSFYSTAAGCRFRANVFQAQFGLGAVFRRVKSDIISLESLGLPPEVKRLASYKNGLVLVGGPPGSGKSTTLAAIIDLINREQNKHVITVEDPIEGVHESHQSLINQRELGTDTASFERALRSMLRMDPDVILIGELRDFTTVEFALRAAETGHLVFGTVHTFSADATVERLVSAHPPDRREQARAMLADNLKAVLCQFLFSDFQDEQRRVISSEVMFNNDSIANVIRKNQSFQIPSIIQTGREQGMRSMDASLKLLYDASRINKDDLYVRLRNKDLYESITGDVPLHKRLAADGSLQPEGGA